MKGEGIWRRLGRRSSREVGEEGEGAAGQEQSRFWWEDAVRRRRRRRALDIWGCAEKPLGGWVLWALSFLPCSHSQAGAFPSSIHPTRRFQGQVRLLQDLHAG